MLVQYPHILVIKTSSRSLVDGEWVFTESEPIELECRGELNTSGRTIGSSSGSAITFDYQIFLPLMDTELKIGSTVTLKITETKQIEGVIKNQENGQLNSRIWL